MKKSFLILLTAISVLFLSACGTTKMPFDNDSEVYSATGNPIFLLSATLKNDYKPNYQPKVMDVVLMQKIPGQEKKQDIFFRTDSKSKVEDDTPEKGNSYFLRFELEKGEYVIRDMRGFSNGFMVSGPFFMPMFSEIKATGPGVYYLGHVQAVTRERKPGELSSSGSIFQMPINQLATMPTGYNDSTFDVVISDQSEKDIPTFKSKFPALKNVAIQKMILPPVDKAEIKNNFK